MKQERMFVTYLKKKGVHNTNDYALLGIFDTVAFGWIGEAVRILHVASYRRDNERQNREDEEERAI
jgi:hypothetical protein